MKMGDEKTVDLAVGFGLALEEVVRIGLVPAVVSVVDWTLLALDWWMEVNDLLIDLVEVGMVDLA